MALFTRLLRAGEGKIVRRLKVIADHIETLEDDVLDLTDDELRAKTEEFRGRYAEGETLDELLAEAFAVVREAAKRTLGQRHYHVQLMGGAAMHLGNIAEMRTGEGKTLAGTLPAYLNALAGKGVHVVTTNDYLAKRDSEWMGRVHRFLGLEVGVILANETPAHRRAQYACDITYGTNNEFGFDYLRDNMAWSHDNLVQRGHIYAIVDEVDSILIDEARTPLIISGPAEQSAKWYTEFARLAPMLKKDKHYEVEEGKRTVAITEEGVEFVEDQLGIENLYEAVNTPLIGYLNNALKVKELYKKDRDYIVVDGEVLIVDEFTGRVLAGRRYNEGMHQAIEAKEKVKIKDENQTLATITLQNYFRLYDKLAGMTGTAQTEAAELSQIYNLGVVEIPTNRPMVRDDEADVVYKTEKAKYTALIDDIAESHEAGQPVLIGTASVEKSEVISALLVKKGIPHEVLNAKNHAREATIIAMAGRKGAVTVATNMAGRGTDIQLGGNAEFMADLGLQKQGLIPSETPEEYEDAWPDALESAEKQVAEEHEEVVDAGGLYVLGTERHESRRIDNQLRGRSGRQGDPGTSRFYLSLSDDLMKRFNSTAVETMMTTLKIPEDQPIESKMVSRAIKSAQTQVEQQNFEIRKNVLKYDDVMSRQREVIYAERKRVLEGADLHEQIAHMLDDVVTAYVKGATEVGYPEDWDLDKLFTALKTLYPVTLTEESLLDEVGGDRSGLSAELMVSEFLGDARSAYDAREEALGAEVMRELERKVVLSVLDRKWREHLYEMDYLREGIHLRAMAQRDPAVEYGREGFSMFAAMLDGIKEESVGYLFNVEVNVDGQPAQAASATDTADDALPAPATEAPLAEAPPAPVEAEPVPEPVTTVKTTASRERTKAMAAKASTGTGSHAAKAPASPPSADKPLGAGAPRVTAKGLDRPAAPKALQYSAPTLDGGESPRKSRTALKTDTVTGTEPSRNAPCHCGSGKKYKRCHGSADAG
ncbi:MAG: preprotein translocase subunit SecA [Geodermatophilaceae bacterium]|nr:preprotein translocase subunit SecA [Geodermatophilaceae bacterium]